MRIALLFPHHPAARAPGVDLVRLEALGTGLQKAGWEVEVVAPAAGESSWRGLPVAPLAALSRPGRYALVKTCYHAALRLLGDYHGPVVCRLVRVVDAASPARDQARRPELLAAQDLAARRARALAFNNRENLERWTALYGNGRQVVLTPTGCPERLPPPGPSPFADPRPAVVFAGSLAAGRMARLLNHLARALEHRAAVHLVGLNKSGLYGDPVDLDPLVIAHGPQDPDRVWGYLAHASLGLALAAGPEPFDNDSSKVVHYLRAGLPTLCEEPVLQAGLVRELGMGLAAPHGREDLLAAAALELLDRPPGPETRQTAARFMTREHAWRLRVEAYHRLFRDLLGRGGRG